jgi:hypothetical protein
MNENIVQWVLMQKPAYLENRLNRRLKRKIGENFSTDFGIIDFAFETEKEDVLIVELETAIDSEAKLSYATEQTNRYLRLKDEIKKPVHAVILYDQENTPSHYVEKLKIASREIGFELKTYSILDIKKLYQERMEELEKTTGIYLGSPVAMDICYLKWLNRLLINFDNNDQIPKSILKRKFSLTNKTGFGVRLKLAEYFDLIEETTIRRQGKIITLTDLGKRFRDNMNREPLIKPKEIGLSLEQKRVLIGSLTNGHFTKSKVNLYYILRFIHITNGEWIPRAKAKIEPEKINYLNYFLGTSYKYTVLTKLVNFTCNQCKELDLIEKIETPKSYKTYQVFLTSLGSRVLGFLELYLHLKREQLQIPLQI